MAKVATITLQAVWDCKWARLAYPIHRETDHWVCVHGGERQPTTEAECQTCTQWELRSDTACAVPPQPETEVRLAPSRSIAVKGLRTILFANAVLLAVWGLAILTAPLFIPITVMLWLGAAGLTGIAAFAPFEPGVADG